MFRKGEYVIYGNNGICCIEEIGVPRDTPLGDSGEEYYTFTTEESEKMEVQRLAERLDGNLELAVRHLAEKMREEQGQRSTLK